MSEHPNIAVNMITTDRLTVCVREVVGRTVGRPVVFVHGNVSSSPFFFPVMVRMPAHIRPIAVDLRGFGGTDTLPVDATRGLSDFADDVWSVIEALGLPAADLVGWSMGGGVVMQMLIDRPDRVSSLALINPVSPYGFGGTHGEDGRLAFPDGAPSGGGTANPDFLAALDRGDPTTGTPGSPKDTLRMFYVAPGWDGDDLDLYFTSMLSTSIGPDNYPGDSTATENWPGVAPGDRGVLNAMAPTHLNLSAVARVRPKPPILWVRGEHDQIVSDTSMFDIAQLGALGLVPDYPGVEALPPQPMLAQTRAVLRSYSAAGGSVTEKVIAGTGHSPHIEKPHEFAEILRMHLGV